MPNKLYFIGVLVITMGVMYLYFIRQQEYKKNFEQTQVMELKFQTKNHILQELKSKTEQCFIPDLISPKQCFEYSQGDCMWNEQIDRCDKKNS